MLSTPKNLHQSTQTMNVCTLITISKFESPHNAHRLALADSNQIVPNIPIHIRSRAISLAGTNSHKHIHGEM